LAHKNSNNYSKEIDIEMKEIYQNRYWGEINEEKI